jgi:hypothetical protein
MLAVKLFLEFESCKSLKSHQTRILAAAAVTEKEAAQKAAADEVKAIAGSGAGTKEESVANFSKASSGAEADPGSAQATPAMTEPAAAVSTSPENQEEGRSGDSAEAGAEKAKEANDAQRDNATPNQQPEESYPTRKLPPFKVLYMQERSEHEKEVCFPPAQCL